MEKIRAWIIILSISILFFLSLPFALPVLLADDWPQVQKDPQHTGYSPETLGTNFRVAWTYPFQPDRVYPQTQAIIYQGKVFAGTEGANGQKPRLIAINAGTGVGAGQKAWEFEADGPILNSAAADNNMVYFATLGGSVYGLDMNGNQVWRNQLLPYKGFHSAPVLANGKIYIGGEDGNLYALNQANGTIIWQYSVSSPILMTVAYNNGRVFAAAYNNKVYAVDSENGSLIWESQPMTGALATKYYWPVVTDGKVLVRVWRNSADFDAIQLPNFYAFDEQTGQMDVSLPQNDGNTHGGATTPSCINRDGRLVVPVWGNWGLLDLATNGVEAIPTSPSTTHNADESLNPTCSQNMVLIFHTEELNANFTGFYNLDTSGWTELPPGHANRQMTSNTQGGGGNPASVSNGVVYHISWHELIVRTTN